MLVTTNHRSENYSAYPGEFKPPFYNWDEVMKEIQRPHEGSKKPSANVSEYIDHYKIEIMAPGHSKEDFIVGIDNNNLSVMVIQTKSSAGKENYRLHEFNFDWFSHIVELPANIDADFVRAEYRAGILSMCFPKVSTPTINTVHRIIVY
jgi:HSP20 family molecular chaperone IbpA